VKNRSQQVQILRSLAIKNISDTIVVIMGDLGNFSPNLKKFILRGRKMKNPPSNLEQTYDAA
jgi:hypothetical protein